MLPNLGPEALFRRVFRLHYLSELPEPVQKRLTEGSALLRKEEDRLRDLVKLPFSPRLSLVDEENATLITGREREVPEERRTDDRPSPTDSKEGGWRGGQ